MVELRLMVNDVKSGKTYKKVISEVGSFVGMKIGDKFSGDLIEMKGFELQITGGSDDSGFPLRGDLSGSVKRKLLVTKGFGAKKLTRKGELARKTVRGGNITNDTAQINAKIIFGSGNVESSLGIKEKEVITESKIE